MDYIREEALSLPIGETLNSRVCPWCLGGSTREKSLSISRTEQGILFKCHRASCGKKGLVHSTGFVDIADHKPKNKEYPYEIKPLNEEQEQFFTDHYGLTKEEVRENAFGYCEERGTYIIPVFNFEGFRVAVNDRDFTGSRKPKSILYWENSEPCLHFPLSGDLGGDTIIIVEDQLSAIKCSRFGTATALLGTNWKESDAAELSAIYSHATLFLDEDAYSTAIKYQKEYSLFFEEGIDVVLNPNDPKDETDDGLRALLGQ